MCNIRHCRKFAHRINKEEILGNTGTKLVSLSFLQDGVGGKIRNFFDFLQNKFESFFHAFSLLFVSPYIRDIKHPIIFF